MGVGTSACKGSQTDEQSGDSPPRSLSTVNRIPFLSTFEDRPPFTTQKPLCDRDVSLLKALTHHRTPFAVIDTATPDLMVVYASGGFVAGMGMSAESIEGTGFAGVTKKGLKASEADLERLKAAIGSSEVRRGSEQEEHVRWLRC